MVDGDDTQIGMLVSNKTMMRELVPHYDELMSFVTGRIKSSTGLPTNRRPCTSMVHTCLLTSTIWLSLPVSITTVIKQTYAHPTDRHILQSFSQRLLYLLHLPFQNMHRATSLSCPCHACTRLQLPRARVHSWRPVPCAMRDTYAGNTWEEAVPLTIHHR